MRVGIDAGGTLIKIAMEDDTHRTLSTELTT
ncbi:MAG: type II pantothenate kinase, partial [Staphylococcus sp.]|nr:type II pantothenate kinase [Staphylococcus sp.]